MFCNVTILGNAGFLQTSRFTYVTETKQRVLVIADLRALRCRAAAVLCSRLAFTVAYVAAVEGAPACKVQPNRWIAITCFCVMERDFAAMDFQQFVCAQRRNISKKVWVMFSS